MIFFLILVGLVLAFSGTVFGTFQGITTAASQTPPVPPVPGAPALNNSDQSLTGSYITQDPATWPGPTYTYPSDKIWNICTAVGIAEGYNLGNGTAPFDLNNPGDLSPGDEAEQTTAGPGEFHGGSTIIHFATCEGGFIALYTKFNNMVTGQSKVFPSSWSWSQVAVKYAGSSQAWLNNVTGYLGVDPNSTPLQYVNS